QNTILVVCFMGFAMGCLSSKHPIIMRNLLIPLLFLVSLMTVPITRRALQKISLLLASTGDLLLWSLPDVNTKAETLYFVIAGLACTLALIFLMWQMFVPAGRILGRLINDNPKPIQAYSINIAGSLVGILAFTLLGAFYQPPLIWFLVLVPLLFYFVLKDYADRPLNCMLLLVIAALAWFYDTDSTTLKILWSPYQKLILTEPKLQNNPFHKYFVI